MSSTDVKDKCVESFIRTKKKEELVHLCQTHQLSTKGTKYDLGLRLQPIMNTIQKSAITLVATTKKKIPLGLKHQKHTKSKPPLTVILHKVDDYYDVHKPTELVFERDTRRVIGHWTPKGIIPLTRKGIDLCQELHFSYRLPNTLDMPLFSLKKKKTISSMDLSDSEADDEDEEFDE